MCCLHTNHSNDCSIIYDDSLSFASFPKFLRKPSLFSTHCLFDACIQTCVVLQEHCRLEELEQQLMALPHLQMRRLETQDCQQSERAFQPQQSNGGEPNVGGSDGVSNQSKIQQHQAANRLWERPQSAMYNTNDIDGDEDDETHNLPRYVPLSHHMIFTV